jgi:hypothetical protein
LEGQKEAARNHGDFAMNEDRFVVVALYPDEVSSVFGPFDSRQLAAEWLAKNKHDFAPEITIEITRLYSVLEETAS